MSKHTHTINITINAGGDKEFGLSETTCKIECPPIPETPVGIIELAIRHLHNSIPEEIRKMHGMELIRFSNQPSSPESAQ